ncbi:MAG: glycoside hydrolase family 97 catalytic domain-containing protein [Bacteroidota bacterium]|nr:glycoside hydrolase family 97 catalytic domain-containing protein [Bacteroidota bacterium]
MLVFVSCTEQHSWQLSSPDGKLIMTVKNVLPESTLFYQVTCRTDTGDIMVISSSPLGIEREDQQFIEGLSFVSASPIEAVNETYSLLHGKRKECHNFSNQLTLHFANEQGGHLDLILRAYNDGVAFRYMFPEEDAEPYTVINEVTGFSLPEDGIAFMMPHADAGGKYGPAYEQYYQPEIAVGTPSPNKAGWSFPALFEIHNGGFWVLISEAGLDTTYFGARLEQEALNGVYRIRMPDEQEGLGIGDVSPTSTLPWATPWRLIIMGESLKPVVESSMVTHLSPSCVVEDRDWIIPGRSSWSWWSVERSPRNFNRLVNFIDLAAEMSWEYSLVDVYWDEMEEDQIRELANYANEKSVGLLLWYNSGGDHNIVPGGPRDRMQERSVRREEFKFLNEIGAKGIKVDFFQSDKQDRIQQYLGILEDAEEFKLMVNFHGCTVTRGWSRTYPHFMTMEAVKGGECYRFDEFFPERAPWHNTILPFTRNVVGPMDYTPVTFSDSEYPHLTTYGHELALSVVYESGWVHFPDAVESYLKTPEAVKDFLMSVPAAWDEIEFLSGYPGKFAVLARQSEDDWYVGGINGESADQTVNIDFSFLDEGEFDMLLIQDGETSKEFSVENSLIRSGQSIELVMPAMGGFVVRLTKQN